MSKWFEHTSPGCRLSGRCIANATSLILTGCRDMHVEEVPACNYHFLMYKMGKEHMCTAYHCVADILTCDYMVDLFRF
jgi:hypothetical protein